MIYLDHSATSRLYPEVASYIAEHLLTDFANPASVHTLGLRQEHLAKDSLASLAADLGCTAQELIVTSGATESTNTAITSTVKKLARIGRRIVTTSGDHDATLGSVRHLKQDGIEAIELALEKDSTVNMGSLEQSLSADTVLISIIAVNNETGAVNDISAVAALRDRLSPKALLHVDYVQAWTKIPISLKKSGADLASFSAHKMHGPKGIGLLYVKQGTPFVPLIHGGGQQNRRRSGTENPLALAAMALASSLGSEHLSENHEKVKLLRRLLLHELDGIPTVLNSPETAVPHIVNLSLAPVRAETLLHVLASREIYISTASACSGAQNAASHVLKAMGIQGERLDSAIRISLAAENTEDEIRKAAAAIKDAYGQLSAVLRKSRRR